jgi:hypothetical protein
MWSTPKWPARSLKLVLSATALAASQLILLAFSAGAAHAATTTAIWGTPEVVPGIASLNTGGLARFFSMSCASAGNCSAGGTYIDQSGNTQAFIVNDVNGTWGTAFEVPGTAALNNGGFAGLESISCASAGNCSAGGFLDHHTLVHAFVVREVNGTWKTAIEVPPPAPLGPGGGTNITALSCSPRGTCSAGGSYDDKTGKTQVFVVSQSG